MRVLVVEDDRKIASFVVQGLQEAGFAVDQTANGAEGLHLALINPYDTAVIDIMLPGLDGLSLVEALRRHKVQTPVIILSGRRATGSGESWADALFGAPGRSAQRHALPDHS